MPGAVGNAIRGRIRPATSEEAPLLTTSSCEGEGISPAGGDLAGGVQIVWGVDVEERPQVWIETS